MAHKGAKPRPLQEPEWFPGQNKGLVVIVRALKRDCHGGAIGSSLYTLWGKWLGGTRPKGAHSRPDARGSYCGHDCPAVEQWL